MTALRLLVAEDFAPFREFLSSMLREELGVQVIYSAADGLEAVAKASEMQPDLIFLDINLPRLNGIDAARQIRELSPNARIIFVSMLSSSAVVQEALDTGAHGYVFKTDLARDLHPATQAALRGERFVSRTVAGYLQLHQDKPISSADPRAHVTPRGTRSPRHGIQFFSDESSLIRLMTRFIEADLRGDASVIVVGRQPRLEHLLVHLREKGIAVDAAIHEDRYISVDAEKLLGSVVVNGAFDEGEFVRQAENLLARAAKASRAAGHRIVGAGECASILLRRGRLEFALQMETSWNQIVRRYNLEILCCYSTHALDGDRKNSIVRQLCAEHSKVDY